MKTFVVTGADRGIGEALVVALAARGDAPIACCLGDSPALRARGIRVEPGVDVTSDAAVAALRERLAGVSIDVLVNVAGIYEGGEFPRLDLDKCRREYEVNALGPLRITQALLPLVAPNGKVAIVTSRVGSLGENLSGGHYGYRMSKAAANMLGVCLALDLAKRGVAVACLHPGTVRTEMTRQIPSSVGGPFVEPSESARGLLERIDELTLETTGRFRHANGEMLPW
jgi:NAD(P)-dependent dehydrogenase (short-subunit alcohol dehydrogenase family)